MGQYFFIVNLTKKEWLHPHAFNEGLKLMEFGCSANGTLTGLTLLLRKSDEGGGGDFHGEDNGYLGHWAGDEIVIVGDYDSSDLYSTAREHYKDISIEVRDLMLQDDYVREDWDEAGYLSLMYIKTGRKQND